MVARDTHTQGRAHRAITSLWHTWRVLLTTVVRQGGSTAHVARGEITDRAAAAVQTAGDSIALTRDPLSIDSTRALRVAIVTGVSAVLVGAGLRVVAAGFTGNVGVAIGGVMMTVAWVAARLLLMRLAPHAQDSERSALSIAWGVGLLPYLLAATGGLRTVAWLASAWLTRRTAVGAGIDAKRATRYVLIAWGVQAGFTVVGWIAKSAGVVLLGSLG